jgi:hypothetical protein
MSTPSSGLLIAHFRRKPAVSLVKPDFPGQTGILKWCGQEDPLIGTNRLKNMICKLDDLNVYPQTYPHT